MAKSWRDDTLLASALKFDIKMYNQLILKYNSIANLEKIKIKKVYIK